MGRKSDERLLAVREIIPAEVRLETIGYFTPSWYPIKVVEKSKKIHVVQADFEGEAIVRVSANPKWGLPITADRDLYLGFQQILWDLWRDTGDIPAVVPFSTRKILSLCNRNQGRDWNRVKAWRRRLQFTAITFDADPATLERIGTGPDRSWSVFSATYGTGERTEEGAVEGSHFVELSSWYRDHLAQWYVRPVDIEGELALRSPIAKALSSVLDAMFFAAGGRKGRSAGTASKRYDDLAQEFLLTRHSAKSLIRQQLDRAHDELRAIGKIDGWGIRRSKADDGWILEWEPGRRMETIWDIWKKEIRLPRTPSSPVRTRTEFDGPASDSRNQATVLVQMFQKKKNAIEDYVPNRKEWEQALELVKRHGFESAAALVEIAIRMMKRTRFEAQWFGSVLAYEGKAEARLKEERRAKRRAAEADRKEAALDRGREREELELERAFEGLAPTERSRRIEEARNSLEQSAWFVSQTRKMRLDIGELAKQEAVRRYGLEKGVKFLT